MPTRIAKVISHVGQTGARSCQLLCRVTPKFRAMVLSAQRRFLRSIMVKLRSRPAFHVQFNAAAGLRLEAIPPHHQPVAIMLDFVDPRRAGWRPRHPSTAGPTPLHDHQMLIHSRPSRKGLLSCARPARSSLSAPRMTILSASSGSGRCTPSLHPTVRASRHPAPHRSAGSPASPSDGPARPPHSAIS